jgi:hypothetical protein
MAPVIGRLEYPTAGVMSPAQPSINGAFDEHEVMASSSTGVIQANPSGN